MIHALLATLPPDAGIAAIGGPSINLVASVDTVRFVIGATVACRRYRYSISADFASISHSPVAVLSISIGRHTPFWLLHRTAYSRRDRHPLSADFPGADKCSHAFRVELLSGSLAAALVDPDARAYLYF